jgi:hypothetical protein
MASFVVRIDIEAEAGKVGIVFAKNNCNGFQGVMYRNCPPHHASAAVTMSLDHNTQQTHDEPSMTKSLSPVYHRRYENRRETCA